MRFNLVFPSLLLCFFFGTANADEASLKKALQVNFPGEQIEA